MSMSRERLQVFYVGRVQGVGFRYTVKALAAGFEVTGIVRNLTDGRVEVILEGTRGELEEFMKAVQDSAVGGFVRDEEVAWSAAKNEFRGFQIVR
jgi:acylphosphatase